MIDIKKNENNNRFIYEKEDIEIKNSQCEFCKYNDLNNKNKFHFIMISYNDYHYSYNYKKKSFVKVNDLDILNNLKLGKISIYKDELIPNIKLNMNL